MEWAPGEGGGTANGGSLSPSRAHPRDSSFLDAVSFCCKFQDPRLDQLVELDGIALTTVRDRRPQGHHLLTGDRVAEGPEILDLVEGEVAVLTEDLDLLDDGEDLLGRELGDLLLELRPPIDDVLGGDDRVVVLDEVDKGNRRRGTDVTHGDCIEARREGVLVLAAVLRGGHAGIRESLGEARPGPLRRSDGARLDGLRRAEVLGVVADEVDDQLIDALRDRPLDPVLVSRDEVVGDEPVEEGRVHLIDVVLR